MTDAVRHTFSKKERLCGDKCIEQLFQHPQRKSLSAFPLRLVYAIQPREQAEEVSARLLISVPKRQLRHAVDRNRVKRQVREAYRKHKHMLQSVMQQHPTTQLHLALLWQSREQFPSRQVEERVKNILQRLVEQL